MEYKLKDLSSLSDIPNMEKVESEVDGIEGGKVLVLRFNDQVHAMSPRCTHYGAPLKLGVVAPDGRLTCPWHGGMLLSFFFFGYFFFFCLFVRMSEVGVDNGSCSLF